MVLNSWCGSFTQYYVYGSKFYLETNYSYFIHYSYGATRRTITGMNPEIANYKGHVRHESPLDVL